MIYDDDKEELDNLTYKASDFSRVRNSLEDTIIEGLEKSFPLDYGGVRLELKNLKYDKKPFSLKDQKRYRLEDKYLSKPLKGDLYLYDSSSNQLLDKLPNKTIMNIPYYTDRGTFIHNGNEYTTLKQSRLRPGIYSRRKANGDLEAQFNIKRGTGAGYRIVLEPSTGIYKLVVGQSNVSLYSILHDLGIDDKQLRDAWGDEIFEANKKKYDTRALDKIYQKLVPAKHRIAETRDGKIEGLKKAFEDQRVESKIKNRNLPII
jgi:DNA-directed RNA polymerase beta subunit